MKHVSMKDKEGVKVNEKGKPEKEVVAEILEKLETQEEWFDGEAGSLDWEGISLSSNSNNNPVVEYEDDEYVIMVRDYYIGEEEEGSETWVVFSLEQFPDRYWRVSGRYDSWSDDNSSWDGPQDVTEVFQKAVVRIVYEETP